MNHRSPGFPVRAPFGSLALSAGRPVAMSVLPGAEDAVAELLTGIPHRSPVLLSRWLNAEPGCRVFLRRRR